jgi:hypothetical protein
MQAGGKGKASGTLTVEEGKSPTESTSPTRVTVILDRSGSMHDMRTEVIKGFNALLDEQRKIPGKTRWSMVQFDHVSSLNLERPFTDLPGKQVPYLSEDTYEPRGSTPLLDAVGTELARLGETADPTIVAIITDGYENASKEYDLAQIRDMIKAREELGWQFIFLGANQDAFDSRMHYGMARGQSVTYDGNTVNVAYASVSDTMSNYRQTRKVDTSHEDLTEKDLTEE